MTAKRLRDLASRTEFIGSFPDALPDLDLPEVAFVGRSNVGKSSALNVLLGGRPARVSARPGRTQAVNLFKIGGEELGAVFADLPGYGYASVPDEVMAAWKPMIERYLAERPTLKLVVCLVDARVDPQPLDTLLLHSLAEFGVPLTVLATKVDKLSKHELKPALARLALAHDLEDLPLAFSAKTRVGTDVLWDTLESACAEE